MNYLLISLDLPLQPPRLQDPVYILEGVHTIGTLLHDRVYVYPASIIADISASYVKKPISPRWGYSVGGLGQYLYDSTVYGADLLNNEGSLLSSITTNPTNKNATTDTGVTQSATSGAGVNLAITITTASGAGTSTVTSVEITTPGTGYAVGDTVTFAAASFGGGVGNDLIITLQAADFNSGSTYGSTNFELHPSEQIDVILNILMYSGVVIRDPQIVQNSCSKWWQQEEAER